MPDMAWSVPVVTPVDAQRRQAKVEVTEDGEVRLRLPGTAPVILPPEADDELCDSIRRARAVANQMGMGL
jgi:hypothetical protein